ncbi:TPA: helix-turn-helix transcriptional regulator, partial [Enterococcus faecium]|nr:helix-turn-helix transcriptional regulator [Enterococcus faecium]
MAQRNLDYRLLKDRRNEYGVSQNKLATTCGLSRPYLNQIENGGVTASIKTMRKIFDQLESFNPELPLTLLFDYVRIRFPTTDARK